MLLATAGGLIRIAAASIFAIVLSASLALAQDTDERPEGVICLQPECDVRKRLPGSVVAPLEAEPFMVERVKAMPVSLLDPELPGMPFELWLFRTLQPYLARSVDLPFSDWSLIFCDEKAGAVPQAGPDLCVETSVPVVYGRAVKVFVRVASGHKANGLTGWREIVPEPHDIYIERLDELETLDSLDVASLSDIQTRLQVPFDQWPTVDLKTHVSWSPQVPKPGEIVRFTISVANLGRRDADRAEVTIFISMPLNNDDLKEIRREWFPRVGAGKAVTLDISARLGRGDATVVVQAGPKDTFKRVRETNGTDNEVVAEIPLIR